MMRLSDVETGYGRKIVTDKLSIEIRKGEIICLIGPNGGGKSTLLGSMNGSLSLIGGSIYLDEKKLKDIGVKELSRQMSIVTTKRVKPPLMTCMDVVMMGRLPHTGALGINGRDDEAAAKKAMELMNIDELWDVPYEALSDGQKQRALIARAICQEPEYLLMDEPTSYMDIKHKLEFLKVCRKLADEGVTIVMSVHEPELAMKAADRLILVYADGCTRCEMPEQVLKNGMLKDLFELDDEMYREVLRGLGDTDNEYATGSSYFINKSCEYFPCHDLSPERFNCMFCYCPLYAYDDCGGEFFYNEKVIKNCKDCSYVHDRTNYPAVIRKLKEKMYEKKKEI